MTSLAPHHKLVSILSELVGPSHFWTQADPQMVIIVLMGDVAPKQHKGKGREGEPPSIPVKLGRYAVMVEFIAALEQLDEPAGSGSRLKSFIEALELRLGAFLEAEVSHSSIVCVSSDVKQEKEGSLPIPYRALVCQLLLRLRLTTMSVRW